jgi:hypothetical protein
MIRFPIIPAPRAFNCSTEAELRSTLPVVATDWSTGLVVVVAAFKPEVAASSGDLAGDRISADAEGLTVSVEGDGTAGVAAEEAEPDDSPLSDAGPVR